MSTLWTEAAKGSRSDLNRRKLTVAVLATPVFLSSCADMGQFANKYEVTRQTVQSFEITTTRLRGDAAFGAITSVFVDRGFDVKVSNKEAGIVTTEHKKIGAIGGSPPFDIFLQVRTTIRDLGGGRTLIRLNPLVKQQNRLNLAAFSEHELYYHEGAPEGIRAADRNGWIGGGHIAFMNIVTEVAQRAGVPMDAVVKNVTSQKFNALLGVP